MQSPIDIQPSTLSEFSDSYDLRFKYHLAPLNLENDGYTIINHCPQTGSVIFGDEEYFLEQFHFHSPSEHKVNGFQFPFEMHFVHKSTDGYFLVIAALFGIKYPSMLLTQFWDNLPPISKSFKSERKLVLTTSLTRVEGYFHYMGSLTTPPYTEGVNWIILDTIFTLSDNQLQNYRNIFGKPTNREIQPAKPKSVVHFGDRGDLSRLLNIGDIIEKKPLDTLYSILY